MSTLEEAEEANGRVTKTFPLNSRRLTAEVLARIARALGLPTNASSAETRQLIEGKLAEDHEPQNVQVDVTELAMGVVEISLRDQDGLFADIPADEGAGEEPERDGGEDAGEGGSRETPTSREEELAGLLDIARGRARELELELERVQETQRLAEQQHAEEVSELRDKLQGEKEKYATLWRLNCVQLTEYDEAIACRDDEIHVLKERVSTLEAHVTSSDSVPSEVPSGGVASLVVDSVSDPGRGSGHSVKDSSSTGAGGGVVVAGSPTTSHRHSKETHPLGGAPKHTVLVTEDPSTSTRAAISHG